ncbi:MAG: helix-turn-helix domain-containing protein [Luteitalea sp.]|nr:helix-turn-helix domain-containing protein [Luteitalea sp.]
MLYLSYTPRPPLSEFVERIWLAVDGQLPRKDRILPSGTIELVVNLREDRVRIDGATDSTRARMFSGVAVSGTYSGVFIVDAMQHAAMMGVHFRPGGAFVVLGVPSGDLTDMHVDLAALWGEAAARELRERLCAAATHRERFQLLEAVLVGRLRSTVRRHPVVPFALERFGPSGLGASVREAARQAGLSHRRFITVFTAEVGLTPKLFCRVLRFQRVHALAQRTGHIDWAQMALACGYFDQSHLANEFRTLSGLSPTEYLRDVQDTLNLLRNHIAIR